MVCFSKNVICEQTVGTLWDIGSLGRRICLGQELMAVLLRLCCPYFAETSRFHFSKGGGSFHFPNEKIPSFFPFAFIIVAARLSICTQQGPRLR